MSDLISRSALLKKECCGRISGDDVRNAPAVDAEPVRHGAWIPEIIDYTLAMAGYEPEGNDVIYKCSLCGREEAAQEPYCHCGAKMDAEVQE